MAPSPTATWEDVPVGETFRGQSVGQVFWAFCPLIGKLRSNGIHSILCGVDECLSPESLKTR